MSFYTHSERKYIMQAISEKMMSILERLAEMFKGSDYQSRLDRYVMSKNPKHPGDVEKIILQFDRESHRGYP